MKRIILLVFTSLLIFNLIACGGGSGISGDWERDNRQTEFLGDEFIDTLTFQGKHFTYVQYIFKNSFFDALYSRHEPKSVKWRIGIFGTEVGETVFSQKLISERESEWWEGTDMNGPFEVKEKTELYQITIEGTYSLNDNTVEFVLSNKTVIVVDVSYTENTINFGLGNNPGLSFVRSGMKRG